MYVKTEDSDYMLRPYNCPSIYKKSLEFDNSTESLNIHEKIAPFASTIQKLTGKEKYEREDLGYLGDSLLYHTA